MKITRILRQPRQWLLLLVAVVLLHYRKAFHLGALRLNPVALGIGLVVFLLWIVVIPAEPEKSAAFATALFAAPAAGVVAWLAL